MSSHAARTATLSAEHTDHTHDDADYTANHEDKSHNVEQPVKPPGDKGGAQQQQDYSKYQPNHSQQLPGTGDRLFQIQA